MTITLHLGESARTLTRVGSCALVAGALALAGCTTSATPGGRSSSASGAPATTSPGSQSPTASPTQPAGGSPGFQVLSMTFVSGQRGFALGALACGAMRCLSLLGTVDGGTTWRQLRPPAKFAGGLYNTCPSTQACASQVRFATPLVGYAFDPSLFLTTDGGVTWRRMPGLNVTSLEAANGNVVRVASSGTGCSGMPYDVQSAPVGTTAWQLLHPPRIFKICPPVLYRQGQRLVLAGYGNPAGGVRATAQIERSNDGGAIWASGPDQCGGRDGYASAVTIAPPDVLVLLCRHQMPNSAGDFGPAWVRISLDGGASFGPDEAVNAPGGLPTRQVFDYQIAAASASRLLVAATGEHGARVYLSENGGRSWTTRLAIAGGSSTSASGGLILVGFQDPLTARIARGDAVWTTYDGGRHWIADHFR